MYIVSFDMGICNLAYCILSINDEDLKNEKGKYQIKEWKRVHLEGDRKNIEELSCSLLDILDYITFSVLEEQSNVIWLIENQPAFKAPTMKSLQIVIYTYAMMMKKNFGETHKAKFMSASSKLKLIEKRLGKIIEKEYKTHKDAAIKYTEQLIKNDDDLMNIFNQEKKKDDLADCFLQALSFIDAF